MSSNFEIYHLRHSQLDERLALLLSPIISAYRPHEPIPTREQLGDPIQQTSVLSHLWDDDPTCNPFTM